MLIINTPHEQALFKHAARRRLAVGHADRVRRAAEPGRAGAGLPDRPRVPRRQAQLPGAGRQHLLRPWPDRACCKRADAREHGATVFGYWVQRSGALRRGRVRCRRQGDRPRGKAGEAALQLRGHRPVLLRRPRQRFRRAAEALAARRAGDHRPQPLLPRRRARCTWSSSAAALPGSTPAPTSRCSRPRTSSRPSRSARACGSAARRRSPTSTAGSTPRSCARWPSRWQERLRPVPAEPARTRARRNEGHRNRPARLPGDRAAGVRRRRAASSTNPSTTTSSAAHGLHADVRAGQRLLVQPRRAARPALPVAASRRASWSACSKARCGTSRSTSAAARRPSAAGPRWC